MRPMRYERSVAMPMTEQTEPSSSPTDWRYTMRPMKQLLLAMIAGCAMLTAACTSGNNTDSQTHWLTSCSADSECGQGLACLCGVCSTECEETAACSSTPGASVCVKRTQGPSEQLCEVQIDVSGICLPECIADDDCSTSQACRYNTCVPLEEVDRIDGDSNNTNNTSSTNNRNSTNNSHSNRNKQKQQQQQTLNPRTLFKGLSKIFEQYNDYEQQDSHEALRLLLDRCRMEEMDVIKKIRKGKGKEDKGGEEDGKVETLRPLVDMVFEGKLASMIICQGCGYVSAIAFHGDMRPR